ncbi:hypothetical protein V6Z12_D04G063300 [Gossypium hirsutum]
MIQLSFVEKIRGNNNNKCIKFELAFSLYSSPCLLCFLRLFQPRLCYSDLEVKYSRSCKTYIFGLLQCSLCYSDQYKCNDYSFLDSSDGRLC